MLLAFEVVLFGGLAFMFFCILRNQDSMLKTMREEHGAILSTLAKLEKRIATLQQLEASIAINPLAVAAAVSPGREAGTIPNVGPRSRARRETVLSPRRLEHGPALFPRLFRRQSPKGRFA